MRKRRVQSPAGGISHEAQEVSLPVHWRFVCWCPPGKPELPRDAPGGIHDQHQPTAEEIRDRLLGPQLHKDAKELSDLCASIPADMDAIQKGMLGKDVLAKLKNMEKLSKRMREELTRASTAP